MKSTPALSLVMLALISACNLTPATPAHKPPATAIPTVRPTVPPPPLNLEHIPLYWFAPLPEEDPAIRRGAADYMDLFADGADWEQAAGYLQVFKLYGGWVARGVTPLSLKRTVAAIRQRGLALAVEVGPLNPTEACGLFVEGFAGEEGIRTLQQIKEAGGDLNFIAFDEPYYYGHFYDGPGACHWSVEKIARDVGAFITQARTIFPDVIIGDIEPMTGPAGPDAYKAWLETFKMVNGYDLAFLHMDIDWGDTSWPTKMKTMHAYGQALGIPIGIIYTGNHQDETTEKWLAIAGERVKRYELENGGTSEHVIFQSWNNKPDTVLPESDPYTFTGFILTYFADKSALGFQPGMISNLAIGAGVQVSRQLAGSEGRYAVDGDPGTLWNAGFYAPQWIEIDLGAPHDVSEIRLLISQHPAGSTTHKLLARSPGGSYMTLQTFSGETSDSQVLVFTASPPLQGIQYIRVETSASPSWVAWREIEVLGAGE